MERKRVDFKTRVSFRRPRIFRITVFAFLVLFAALVLVVRRPFFERPRSSKTTTTNVPLVEVARCETTKGAFEIQLNPFTAPNSVHAFKEMVEQKWFDNRIAFFRKNRDMIQFGAVKHDVRNPIPKEITRDLHPVRDRSERIPWKRGDVSWIGGTQFVLVLRNGTRMGLNDHDSVLGTIEERFMSKVPDAVYAYNDIIDHPRGGDGPDQRDIFKRGWEYLDERFPKVDAIVSCRMMKTRERPR